jgi:hypothetical protein
MTRIIFEGSFKQMETRQMLAPMQHKHMFSKLSVYSCLILVHNGTIVAGTVIITECSKYIRIVRQISYYFQLVYFVLMDILSYVGIFLIVTCL